MLRHHRCQISRRVHLHLASRASYITKYVALHGYEINNNRTGTNDAGKEGGDLQLNIEVLSVV